jgi:hypothetical protein
LAGKYSPILGCSNQLLFLLLLYVVSTSRILHFRRESQSKINLTNYKLGLSWPRILVSSGV